MTQAQHPLPETRSGAHEEAAQTQTRKAEHVRLCLSDSVGFSRVTGIGFDQIRFMHNAVPEVNFNDLTLETTFLTHVISAPFMISSMTGGYSGATAINRVFARVAEHERLPMGVGSMRQALLSEAHRDSFSCLREMAPTIPLFANIGAPEIAKGLGKEQVRFLLELIDADGLIIHLNAAQELFQPEGNTDFKGVLEGIEGLKKLNPSLPLIAKEVGNGISKAVAARLVSSGIDVIDVAGAGGTNWQKVESMRTAVPNDAKSVSSCLSPGAKDEFLNWGISTVHCLLEMREFNEERGETQAIPVIASGGIRHGLDAAKALNLGAKLVAAASPFLKAAYPTEAQLASRSEDEACLGLSQLLQQWKTDLKAAMFLTGIPSVHHFPNATLLRG